MPDWQEHVQRHLRRLGVGGEREEEIRAELAEHLEDAYQDALRRGLSPEAAMEHAQEQVPNWRKLAGKLRRASKEEDMNDRVRHVWLPGAAAAALTPGLWAVLAAAGLQPVIVWDDWHPLVFLFLPWLFLLPLVGAVGAYWSRRCGGSQRDLWIASLLPALAMAAYLTLPSVVAFVADPQISLAFKLKVAFWRGYFGMVLLPAALLSLGVFPFLRERVTA
jgi:hypothetical protein